MKQKPKLALKKIMVSNLADDVAKRVYGGDDPTYGENCSISCAGCTVSRDPGPGCPSMACPSNLPTECNSEPTCDSLASCNNYCFSAGDCTYAECTDQNGTCPATHQDPGCPTVTCFQSVCPC